MAAAAPPATPAPVLRRRELRQRSRGSGSSADARPATRRPTFRPGSRIRSLRTRRACPGRATSAAKFGVVGATCSISRPRWTASLSDCAVSWPDDIDDLFNRDERLGYADDDAGSGDDDFGLPSDEDDDLLEHANRLEDLLTTRLTEESDPRLKGYLATFRAKSKTELALVFCSSCNRRFIGGGNVNLDGRCTHCTSSKPTRWTAANQMDPGPQSEPFRTSTVMERSVVAAVQTSATLKRAKGGQGRSTGHVMCVLATWTRADAAAAICLPTSLASSISYRSCPTGRATCGFGGRCGFTRPARLRRRDRARTATPRRSE
jgi:hypothetical protein